MKLKCVICTTVKLPGFGKNVLDSFVKYHLEIGFSHIYIFFDDANDASIGLIKAKYSINEVTIFLPGDDLKSKWSTMCLSYNDLWPYVEDEVQARQRLNCEVALKEAYIKNMTGCFTSIAMNYFIQKPMTMFAFIFKNSWMMGFTV